MKIAQIGSGTHYKNAEHNQQTRIETPELEQTEDSSLTLKRIRVHRFIPMLTIHLLCLGVIWVGVSSFAVLLAVALYIVRMFFITAFYHRYFSHRAFRMHRITQLIATFLCTTCAQRGPLWWAAHHRGHHRHSDDSPDIHSPAKHGFLWSHMGWIYSDGGTYPDYQLTRDFLRFKEVRWLDKYHILGPLALAVGLYFLGQLLAEHLPELGNKRLAMCRLGIRRIHNDSLSRNFQYQLDGTLLWVETIQN